MTLFFYLLSLLPLGILRAMAFGIYAIMRLFAFKYNRRFTEFFTNSIDVQSDTQHNLVRASMKQVLFNGLLLPKIWLSSSKLDYAISDDIESQKQWHALFNRHKTQQGTLLLTLHLGVFEFLPRLIALNNKPFFALYKPSKKAWVNRLLNIGRDFPGVEMCPANMSGVKKMINALKNGQISVVLPDQVPTSDVGAGVIATFFKKPAKTMVLPFRLAKAANVPLVWVIVIPTIEHSKLKLTVYLKEHHIASTSISTLMSTQIIK